MRVSKSTVSASCLVTVIVVAVVTATTLSLLLFFISCHHYWNNGGGVGCVAWQWTPQIHHHPSLLRSRPSRRQVWKRWCRSEIVVVSDSCFYYNPIQKSMMMMDDNEQCHGSNETMNRGTSTTSTGIAYDKQPRNSNKNFYNEINHTRLLFNDAIPSSSYSVSKPVVVVVPNIKCNNDHNDPHDAWYRAYQQIHAMLNMTSNTTTTTTSSSGSKSLQHDTRIISRHEELNESTNMIVLMAFEEFVRRLLQQYKNNTVQSKQAQSVRTFNHPHPHHHPHMDHDSFGSMEALDDLLNKICTTTITTASPTRLTMESIWTIYQSDLKQQISQQQQQPKEQWQRIPQMIHNRTEWTTQQRRLHHQRHIIRTTRLLRHWLHWSNQYGTPLYQQSPPIQWILQLFSDIQEHGTFLSTDMWSLYMTTVVAMNDEYHHHHHRNNQWQQQLWTTNGSHISHHPRIQLDRIMLQIVSKSEEWEHCQCTILQAMIRSSSLSTISPQQIVQLHGGLETFWRALVASAKVGRVADTSWLSRFILSSANSTNQSEYMLLQSRLHMIHIESLCHSNDPGSFSYLERYTWQNPDGSNSIALHSTSCVMLLTKFSKTKCGVSHQQLSIGRRAEKFLHRAYQSLYSTHWHPDVHCAHCIVEAYLPPLLESHPPPLQISKDSTQLYWQQLRTAEHFIRQFIQQFGLRNPAIQQKSLPVAMNNNSSDSRIFARLFDAYRDIASLLATNGNNCSVSLIHVAQQADTLFRYFMIQYRNGRFSSTDEYPTMRHMEQLRSVFHCCTQAISLHNATKSTLITRQLFRNIEEYKYLLKQYGAENSGSRT